MLILNEADLRRALTMNEVIDAVEEGFRSLARGEARAPERMRFALPEESAVLLEMPAAMRSASGDALSALGTKVVSVFERNSERGLDSVQAAYLLLDANTGAPLSLMEGKFITGIRTAAASAVATKYMAGPGMKRLAIFGAGVQGVFHVEAMMAVAEVDRVLITSRTEARARRLAQSVRSQYKVPCDVVGPEEAVSAANLICTGTTSAVPVIQGDTLKPGTHINAVGAYGPDRRELDTETIRRARVIIDDESAAGREAGEILIPIAEGAITASHVKGTLSDLVSGRVLGRSSPEEVTVFKSSGLAIEDLVTARLAYSAALERGIGTHVDF
jgi:alanine dehydrogenase